jgi:hypothetical protein
MTLRCYCNAALRCRENQHNEQLQRNTKDASPRGYHRSSAVPLQYTKMPLVLPYGGVHCNTAGSVRHPCLPGATTSCIQGGPQSCRLQSDPPQIVPRQGYTFITHSAAHSQGHTLCSPQWQGHTSLHAAQCQVHTSCISQSSKVTHSAAHSQGHTLCSPRCQHTLTHCLQSCRAYDYLSIPHQGRHTTFHFPS